MTTKMDRSKYFEGAGAGLCVGAVAALAQLTHAPMMLGSLGATSMLLFALPGSPMARPRSVIGGHLLSSAIGLAGLHLLGPSWWSLGLAVALAITLMLATRTTHLPAASNVLIVYSVQPGLSFLLAPTLVGALTVLALSFVWKSIQSRIERISMPKVVSE
jgi:CBS-domain-containing membrane protein